MNLPIEVVEAVNAANCVLFVGSRAAAESAELAGLAYPDAQDLAKDLGWRKPKAMVGARQKRAPAPSVFEGADTYARERGRKALVQTLSEATALQGVAPSPAYDIFLRRFPLVFTTCRDGLFEAAGKRLGGTPTIALRGAPIPEFDVAQRAVIKLWGGFEDEGSLVVTPGDLQTRPLDADARKAIRNLIRKKVVFFVGYRPDEEEFELLWNELTECYGGELPRCHLAVAQGQIDDYLWQKWVWRGLLMFTADPSEAMAELEKGIEG